MKLTKHVQACIELDVDGVKLVFDPSEFEKHIDRILKDANAVLVTHIHSDHFDRDGITKALEDNPELKVYGPESVVEALGAHGGRVIAVHPGESIAVGSVTIDVYGSGKHAEIHSSMPLAQNVCYFVNGVYHPGDSFDVPDVRVETLLLPTSGPWMKTGEAADFVLAIKPAQVISIHDAIDSDVGHQIANDFIGQNGITGQELIQLKEGKSIEV